MSQSMLYQERRHADHADKQENDVAHKVLSTEIARSDSEDVSDEGDI